jgi:hypothetical protein
MIAIRTRPMNSPCSTTPGMAARRDARAPGSRMLPSEASRMKCPPSVSKGWPALSCRNAREPGQPAARAFVTLGKRIGRDHAERLRILGVATNISIRLATAYVGISRSWTTLAGQLERLDAIIKDESNLYARQPPRRWWGYAKTGIRDPRQPPRRWRKTGIREDGDTRSQANAAPGAQQRLWSIHRLRRRQD